MNIVNIKAGRSGSKIPTKVQVVRCPEVHLPADMARSKPSLSSFSSSSSSSSSSSFGAQRIRTSSHSNSNSSYNSTDNQTSGRKRDRSRSSDRVPVGFVSSKDIKDEIRGYLGEIKGLAATSFTGLKKKKFKEDKLTKLGAPDVKSQRMPFQMKMGIEKGKKRRQVAAIHESKEAGIVLASPKKVEEVASSSSRSSKGGRKSDELEFGDKVRGGVMHVKNRGRK